MFMPELMLIVAPSTLAIPLLERFSLWLSGSLTQ